MFYVQKVDRPVLESDVQETEVVFTAFKLQGKSKNLNKKAKGYASLDEAAKSLGITVSDIEYDPERTSEELEEEVFELAFAESEREREVKEREARKDAFRKTYKP